VYVCSELVKQADGQVAAVCLSGIAPTLLPAVLYGADTRASEEVEELYRAMLKATAFGTRHLLEALRKAGGKSGTDWSTIAEVVEPDPENREVYDEPYGVYKGLYPATRPMSHVLADVQTRGET
jgi:sugar (pentulose or hexulose) kinase